MSRKKLLSNKEKLLCKRISELREEKFPTQTVFADLIKVEPNYVSQIEAEKKVPSKRLLEKMAEVFNVSLKRLQTGKGPAQPLLDTSSEQNARILTSEQKANIVRNTPKNLKEDSMFWEKIVDRLTRTNERLENRVEALTDELNEARLPRKTKKKGKG